MVVLTTMAYCVPATTGAPGLSENEEKGNGKGPGSGRLDTDWVVLASTVMPGAPPATTLRISIVNVPVTGGKLREREVHLIERTGEPGRERLGNDRCVS